MTLDWEREIDDTAFTPADALRDLLAMVDDVEALVIVAAIKEGAGNERFDNCIIVRKSDPRPYVAIGLLHDGLDSVLRRNDG